MRSPKWLVPVAGSAVWAGSWYLMYLEITRWHHVKPSLAFNSDIAPGARPGLPLMVLYAACAASPLFALAGLGRARARR
ncbi:hypothetical protein DFJ67_6910 [Asanoa ferruginea]|uniref:Uncharacterized protein n=1 Tax=Asanoa ferruginea TaxID=53367 RepID=A0A3D9ZWC2_9ACTN|nr:hypothetical protein [Asanoa ferruginea]REG00853.1 hypothetical protein DFJ67_6910 [Asanoa ferruginea]GIF47272.1 hypothetical protein Afe04nite_18110 [Asanoa ferruginea]